MSPRESDDEEDEVGTRAERDRASRRNKRVKDCSRQVMQSPWSVHLTKLGPSSSVSSPFLFILFLLFLPSFLLLARASISFSFLLSHSTPYSSSPSSPSSSSISSFSSSFSRSLTVTLSRHSSFFPTADYVCVRETSPGL